MNAKTSKRVYAYLESLGSTDKEVASFLKENGIKGWPGNNGGDCPIKMLLKRRFPKRSIGVGFGYVEFYDESGEVVEELALPEPVSDFIWKYDIKQFPELIHESHWWHDRAK